MIADRLLCVFQTDDAPTPLAAATAEALKGSIVQIMISLSQEPALQVQIGQAISIMAEADFPDQWEGLIDVRSASLRPGKVSG